MNIFNSCFVKKLLDNSRQFLKFLMTGKIQDLEVRILAYKQFLATVPNKRNFKLHSKPWFKNLSYTNHRKK